MTLLGIDYGAKKIGLAKAVNGLAVPLGVVANISKSQVLEQLQAYCQQENVEKIIVGVPISLKSSGQSVVLRDKDLQNQQMQEVLAFINWLKKNLAVPIEFEDERLTTKLARGLQKDLTKKNGDDAVAAMLILQTYLDRGR